MPNKPNKPKYFLTYIPKDLPFRSIYKNNTILELAIPKKEFEELRCARSFADVLNYLYDHYLEEPAIQFILLKGLKVLNWYSRSQLNIFYYVLNKHLTSVLELESDILLRVKVKVAKT